MRAKFDRKAADRVIRESEDRRTGYRTQNRKRPDGSPYPDQDDRKDLCARCRFEEGGAQLERIQAACRRDERNLKQGLSLYVLPNGGSVLSPEKGDGRCSLRVRRYRRSTSVGRGWRGNYSKMA